MQPAFTAERQIDAVAQPRYDEPSALSHTSPLATTVHRGSTASASIRDPIADANEGATDIIISCENVHKTYLLGIEGIPALRGVSVDVVRGEMLVIYGTSGGGKSTLLNVLGTIDVPTKGNLELLGTRVTDSTADNILAFLRCERIGFVFQSFNLLSSMTAVENVELPMIIAGHRSRSEIRARATDLLRHVGLGHRLDHFPSQLSGGEQQRVTISRALANEPDVLLLDEPTGDLDTRNTHLIMSILLNLNRQKRLTMIMVTHDVYMKQYAHRILYLRDGKVSHVETNDPHRRLAAVDANDAVVEQHRVERSRGRQFQDAEWVLRQPQEYETYTSKASPDVFTQHEQPALFAKLFPSRRQPLGAGDPSQVTTLGI